MGDGFSGPAVPGPEPGQPGGFRLDRWLRRCKPLRLAGGLCSAAPQTQRHFFDTIGCRSGPFRTVKMPPPCLQYPGKVAFIEVAFQKIAQHQSSGAAMRVDDQHRPVFIRTRGLDIRDSGAVEQPRAELPQAQLPRHRPAIHQSKQLRKLPLESLEHRRNARGPIWSQHSRRIGDALHEHRIGTKRIIRHTLGKSAVRTAFSARLGGLGTTRAFQVRSHGGSSVAGGQCEADATGIHPGVNPGMPVQSPVAQQEH